MNFSIKKDYGAEISSKMKTDLTILKFHKIKQNLNREKNLLFHTQMTEFYRKYF